MAKAIKYGQCVVKATFLGGYVVTHKGVAVAQKESIRLAINWIREQRLQGRFPVELNN